jgi:hypothetical protein
MPVHRLGRFLHRAVPSFRASSRGRESDRFAARTLKDRDETLMTELFFAVPFRAVAAAAFLP